MGFFSHLQRSKSSLNALPRFSRSRPTPAAPSSPRQGSSLFARCSRPTLLGASPRASPSSSSSLQLRSFFGSSFVSRISPWSPSEPLFQAWRTQSIAERVVEAIKHEQVREETRTEHDQYDLGCLGISKGGSCKMQVWRNLGPGSRSWTARLEGPRWRASVLDCPDLSGASLPGRSLEVGHTVASPEAEMLAQDLYHVIDRIRMIERLGGNGFFSSLLFTCPEIEMIVEDHCLVTRPPMLLVYLVDDLFCAIFVSLSAWVFHFAGKGLKLFTSEYTHVPLFTCCTQPTLLGTPPRASSPPSGQLSSYIYGYRSYIPVLPPFQAEWTRSIAERVVEAIRHEQVRDKEEREHDQCSLWSFGVSDGLLRSCKVHVWQNSDHRSPSWTVLLEGPGWQASVMDRPDLSPASLPGGQMAVSAESLDFCKTDAETFSIAAQEVGHTMARHGEEMLVQDISLAIRYIHIVELPWWLGFLNSLLPKVKMIMEDHRLEVGLPLPPPYVMLGVFGVLGVLGVLGVFATS